MSKIQDNLKMKGRLQVSLNGEVVRDIDNLVVTAGKAYVADRMKNNSSTMSHMAIGSGTTAAAAGNTALGTELGRVALTSTTVTSNSVAYVGDFPAGTGTGAVVEAGILNASSGGTLLCRTVFSVVNKAAADTLKITWTVTVSDS